MKIFTNGCFFLVHPGHIILFKEIKKIFPHDKLIVGINSNKSIYRLKNRNAIIDDIDRLEMLLSIKYVDDAYIFEENTPYKLIKKIKPDIIVKGADYNHVDIIGSDVAKATITINHYKKYSTTGIIKEINNI
jgi:D-beta-D-heptose 7-phosphate kinase/D-beta-D-heptose 1-phosphate adenosyltransferase